MLNLFKIPIIVGFELWILKYWSGSVHDYYRTGRHGNNQP